MKFEIMVQDINRRKFDLDSTDPLTRNADIQGLVSKISLPVLRCLQHLEVDYQFSALVGQYDQHILRKAV